MSLSSLPQAENSFGTTNRLPWNSSVRGGGDGRRESRRVDRTAQQPEKTTHKGTIAGSELCQKLSTIRKHLGFHWRLVTCGRWQHGNGSKTNGEGNGSKTNGEARGNCHMSMEPCRSDVTKAFPGSNDGKFRRKAWRLKNVVRYRSNSGESW